MENKAQRRTLGQAGQVDAVLAAEIFRWARPAQDIFVALLGKRPRGTAPDPWLRFPARGKASQLVVTLSSAQLAERRWRAGKQLNPADARSL